MSEAININKVGLIGTGMVGASFAYSLMQHGLVNELVLIDANAARAEGEMVTATELAGETIKAKLTHASSNGAPIGGLKVVTENGWFAARPSGTEDVYKIYREERSLAERSSGVVAT